ncbi:MAG: zinc ribbon domain-containing protein [Actinomycetota bacterium]|nr:zinc ribbon domain-containing protein [Actinomycetota bacterium]
MGVKCAKCGTENSQESSYCKECGALLGEEETGEVEALGEIQPTGFARFLSAVWGRKGPILMAICVGLMMGLVFAPWAFVNLKLAGLTIASRQYSGWEIYVPRILFFLSIIPLAISLLLIVGIGTRRRVIETHICTFFAGVIFTVWLVVFLMSNVLSSFIARLKVVQFNPIGGQVATIFLLAGFIIGIIITSYDRGRLLRSIEEG